jgi:hypothetical protein
MSSILNREAVRVIVGGAAVVVAAITAAVDNNLVDAGAVAFVLALATKIARGQVFSQETVDDLTDYNYQAEVGRIADQGPF